MNRKDRRATGKRINKMSPSQRFDLLTDSVAHFSQIYYDDTVAVLRKEFGFGDKRIAKFTQAFNKQQRSSAHALRAVVDSEGSDGC